VKDSLECFRIISSAQPSKTNARSWINRKDRKHFNSSFENSESVQKEVSFSLLLIREEIPWNMIAKLSWNFKQKTGKSMKKLEVCPVTKEKIKLNSGDIRKRI
jgi:hypothetical protein